MDWSRVTFDWNRALTFLVTADEGSFSAAGRALGLAQPTVGRQVAALEEELEVVLFERVGKSLQLTPTALELVEHVRAMAAAAVRVSRVAAGQSLSLEGSVCVSAGDIVASALLPPILSQIRSAYPEIDIEIIASNQISDLGRREADIAIRNVAPADSELVAKKVRDAHAFLYATPGYLASIGSPATPAELSRAEFIDFDHSTRLLEGLNALGLQLTPKSFPWVSSNQHVQWALVTQGTAVGVMLAEVGDRDARVQRALPSLPAIPVPIYIAAHREVRTSRRVRVVFDMLAEGLARSADSHELD